MSLGRRTRSGMKAPSRAVVAKADEERADEAAKITRLRALRLAKEAAERDAMPTPTLPQRTHGLVRPRRANDAT
jgi:hypothetical protein